ncbi:type II secretion system F family protein, partial [Salmonella enterica subsp. enterica serovar Kentucky]|nr:type II secretion system F family protein [Salmonella enterica subsp. enterica serovar Kentucky]
LVTNLLTQLSNAMSSIFLLLLTVVFMLLEVPQLPEKLQQMMSTVWLALKNTQEFSPLCLQLVRTGEASGSLDIMLHNLARHHSET